jgi:general secretion pathway protein A
MYETHFGLQRKPFTMTPDPSFFFQTHGHREALAALLYAVREEKGFIVLTGDAGSGKTTLLSSLLRMIPSTQAVFSLVFNPTVSPDEFLELALLDFGIEEIRSSKAWRLHKLQEVVMEAHTAGRTCVLVVDEAHKLSAEVLEEIRLLTNFENAERKLLQIVLAGQPELRNTLNAENLRQLKQRIAVRCQLQALSGAEVVQYIHFRWLKAGGRQELPFDQDALQIIAHVSGGLPRVINALCDNALLLIYGAGDAIVTAVHVRQVARDLDLGEVEWQTASPNGTPALARLNLPSPVPVGDFRATRVPYPAANPQRRMMKTMVALNQLMRAAGTYILNGPRPLPLQISEKPTMTNEEQESL